MYKSPVDIFEEISTKITEETDNHIVAEIEKAIGVSVDKDELIKALNYDRNQYNQGYNDAKELYAPKRWEWIPVSERLPQKEGRYLCTIGAKYRNPREMYYAPQAWANKSNDATWKDIDGNYVYDWFIIAWMPLPEPYKTESEGNE